MNLKNVKKKSKPTQKPLIPDAEQFKRQWVKPEEDYETEPPIPDLPPDPEQLDLEVIQHTVNVVEMIGETAEKPEPIETKKADGQIDENQNLIEKESDSVDRMDENQIIDSMQGNYTSDFVYEFCADKKQCKHCGGKKEITNACRKVKSLSWVAIREASRALSLDVGEGVRWIFMDSKNSLVHEVMNSDLKVAGLLIMEFPDRVRVTAQAKDNTRKITRFGCFEQPKMMKGFGGKSYQDIHCIQKAISKAERNALKQLLPQKIVNIWIQTFDGSKASSQEEIQNRIEKAVNLTDVETFRMLLSQNFKGEFNDRDIPEAFWNDPCAVKSGISALKSNRTDQLEHICFGLAANTKGKKS